MTLGGGYRKDAWATQSASVSRTIRRYGLTDEAAPRPPGREKIDKAKLNEKGNSKLNGKVSKKYYKK